LSDAEIYSPLIYTKPQGFNNKYHEVDTEFVKGNYPHFIADTISFDDIIFSNCNKYKK
jgi:hypothetical protein